MSKFLLQVVTPERDVIRTEVEVVVLPGADGELGVLANHAPLAAALKIGVIRFGPRGVPKNQRRLACGGGFAEMHDNALTVLADTAELAEEIDVLRAKEAAERSRKRLDDKQADWEYSRTKFALEKALNRIQAAEGE